MVNNMKKELKNSLTGKQFGRWLVLDQWETVGKKKERKWLCRCECGTEKYVLERSLLYGGSRSCGCLARERTRQANAHDLTGQAYGELTVLSCDENNVRKGNRYWKCRCSCGKEISVAATLLVCGRKTSCGCKSEYKDIRGKRINRLVAEYPSEKRDAKGSVIWHCKCDCGNEVDLPYNTLVYSNIKSCGCQKKENDKILYQNLARVDGTSLDTFRNNKISVNNTSGARGVYFIRNKYVAKIVFQKKQYYLGSFSSFDDAVEARKFAEEVICGDAVSFYEKWKAKADAEPQWAKENPIRFSVRKTDNQLSLDMFPVLE